VRINIKVPVDLNPEEVALFKNLKKIDNQKVKSD
jgi:hypothetical protein